MTRRRGQVIQRGERTFLLRVFLGRDANGSRRFHNVTFHGSRREAQTKLTSLLVESDTQTLVTRSTQTFEQFIGVWETYKVDVSEFTLADYQLRIRKFLLPVFGTCRLQQITTPMVQQAIADWIARGLSPRVIQANMLLLHQILAKAVDLGYLVKNPTTGTARPTLVKRSFTVLSVEQMVQLFRANADTPYVALWVLLLTTGLRPGEALGIQWSDLKGNLLTVNRTVRLKRVQENQAKTDGSLRTIMLSELAVAALQVHRARHWKPISEFVFQPRTRGGLFYEVTAIRRAWKQALERAGLPDTVRLYDTRHSHATALLNNGVSLTAIADRLGHANTRITEAVYARLLPRAREEVADVMNRLLTKGKDV